MKDKVLLNEFGYTITASHLLTKKYTLQIKDIVSVEVSEAGHMGILTFLGGIFMASTLNHRASSFGEFSVILLLGCVGIGTMILSIYSMISKNKIGGYYLHIEIHSNGIPHNKIDIKFYRKFHLLKFHRVMLMAMKGIP